MNITFSECVFVALSVQHTMCMRRILIFVLSDYDIFPHYLISGTIFEKKKKRYLT